MSATNSQPESKAPAKVNPFAIAKQDAINPNTTPQPVFIPSYGGKKIPVSLVFSQSYQKPETMAVTVEKPVYETDENEKPVYELKIREGVTDGKGNQVFEKVYKVKEKKVATTRIKTGGMLNEKWDMVIPFETSAPDDLRRKLGEGFETLKAKILQGNKIGNKSKPYHLTVRLNDVVLSTTSLPEGGAKLSACFEKKVFKNDLFRDKFCRVLWAQLGQVKDLATGKPLSVSDEILQALDLVKK